KGTGVYRSDDGGKTWTPGRGLPDATVTSVELDPRDAFRGWASLATTIGPSVYRTNDGGLSWVPAAAGLPPFAAQVVRVDPTDSNDLFCGTDVGVFRSTDAGGTWARFGTGLPAVSVHDVDVFEDGSIVRVATYGRGIWELRVPSTGNRPPAASISAPSGEVAVNVGGAVDFAGAVTDPDPGDRVSGFWYFGDDATAVNLAGPSGTIRHVFRRAGVYLVSLAAIDSRGARGSASVTVSVREPADSCASPLVFPGTGPFPYTIRVNNKAGTTEAADPGPSCLTAGRTYTTWFEFTPRTAGTYEFSTCGAEVATLLSLYTGSACGPYTAIPSACRATGLTDTDCGPGASGMLVSTTAAAGQTIRVLLSSIPGTIPPNLGGFVPVTVTAAGRSPGFRVLRVEYPSGPPEGGSTVSITGSGFTAGSTVTFGGVAAADVAFGGSTVLTARTPPHAAGFVDVAVTIPGLGTATLQNGFLYEDSAPPPCASSATVLCLNGGRFRVEARWRVTAPAEPRSGSGTGVPLTSDTGYFWFFSSSNIELVVKVVDGRAVNGKFWVFYGALSDVEYQITVTDLVTGAVKVYSNPAGTLASVADTNAF
ncbi:MAG TPA: IPT/TIG domain-containing protein, partial [Thermoanaerobaculia bacterium]